MIASINAAAVVGIEAFRVAVEADFTIGLRDCHLVGLPDGAIRESIKRVTSALTNSGYEWPRGRITINLAPAGIRKDGTGFDLPIALAVLMASQQVSLARERVESTLLIGELSLDGRLLPVPGVLPRATLARDAGLQSILVPAGNAAEASVVAPVQVVALQSLPQAVAWLSGRLETPLAEAPAAPERVAYPFDFSEVKGQLVAKRALEIAAAGGHNVLMIGPPGAGKTMLARRMVTLLPSLSIDEAIETTKVYSVAAALAPGQSLLSERPFCAPHFTISEVGLVGGGAGIPRPGQVSLAHNGVLFLDELPEFSRNVLEVLRGPLEDKQVTLTRGMVTVTYPASIMLIAAMNPCPCGYAGSQRQACVCAATKVAAYRHRLSGPLLDRIDLQTTVANVAYSDLASATRDETSASIRARVEAARRTQQQRFIGSEVHCNAQMEPRQLRQFCQLDNEGHRLLERCIDVMGMSARAYSRILKVARTIADLGESPRIRDMHVAEAVGYRQLDVEGPAAA